MGSRASEHHQRRSKAMKRSEKLKKVPYQYISELPDCVMSHIFSKLSMKDLVKTSTLSKRWHHEWGSRMDLNFDLHNMFDNDTIIQVLPAESHPLFKGVISDFATRVDQFLLHYQGAKIRSLRVNFPLGDEHSDLIGKLVSQGVAKGAERIELLFSYKTTVVGLFLTIKPYKFSCALLSESDSLKYLHLQNCLLVPPMSFSGLKQLTTLVLQLVVVEHDMLLGLFSSCINLVDLTLNDCEFNSDLNITSPTLSHLNIIDCRPYLRGAPPPRKWKIDIFALNLSSFECASEDGTCSFNSIKAPQLSRFSCSYSLMPPVVFSGLKNLTAIVLLSLLVPQDLLPCFCECLQLEHLTLWRCTFQSHINIISPTLRHLNIIDFDNRNENLPWKIDIDTLNLSSFEYRGDKRISSIKAPQLLKVFWNDIRTEEIPSAFDVIASFHMLENLALIMSPSQIATLPRVLGPFYHLRKLELFIRGAPNQYFFRILDIVMASPRLQKLCLTNLFPCLFTNQRQRRELASFSHHELKDVVFSGCAGNTYEIQLAQHFLKNVSSLKQITFDPCGTLYQGAGEWSKRFGNDNWSQRERNLIHEALKDRDNKQCLLIIL